MISYDPKAERDQYYYDPPLPKISHTVDIVMLIVLILGIVLWFVG